MLAVPPMSGAGKHAAPDAQPAGPPAAAHRRPAAAPLYAAVAPAEPTEGEEEEEEAEEPERCIVRTQVEMEAPMSHAQEWKQEWGRANLPARIHGPGFRPCVSKRRIKERCARAFCLCAGEDARRAPKCTVVYTGIYCAATKLFTIEETGSHHRPAEGEQVQEASARKPRRNCRALMLDLPEVYTKTVQQQPKSTLDFVQQANKWSRDPDNFKGSEGEKPFKVSVMSGFKFPGNKTPTYLLLQCSSCAIALARGAARLSPMPKLGPGDALFGSLRVCWVWAIFARTTALKLSLRPHVRSRWIKSSIVSACLCSLGWVALMLAPL